MKTIIRIVILVCIGLAPGLSLGRTIGSDIYPTDDELFEAYLDGEIDYQTYLNLKDIFESGIDSTDLYLLEEIPNVGYFFEQDLSDYTGLKQEQAEPFIEKSTKELSNRPITQFQWKRYQKLETDGLDQNRFYINSRLSQNWTCKVNGADDYYGRQEFSMRSLSYHNSRGTIRNLRIGNYTARFGLGLTVGYRGRLLDKNDLTTGETALYPDYGGFNGFYAEGGPQKNRLKWLFHYDRDDAISTGTTALNFTKAFGNYKVEGTVLGSILRSRLSNIEYDHYQLGLLLGYYEPEFDAAFELALPKGGSENNMAALIESSYKRNKVKIRFSSWFYGQDYINFFGGGRSGDIYKTITVEKIGLQFSDRRTDQTGMLLKTSAPLSDISDFNLSFSTYGNSRYRRNLELLTSFGHSVSKNSEIRLYYELYNKERDGNLSENNIMKIEYSLKNSNLSIRTYFGFRNDNDGDNFLSHFIRAKLKNKIFKELEIWLNFSRINIETSNIDYFYGYLRELVNVSKSMALAIKYIYRYNRAYSDREESTLYLETSLVW